MGMVQRYRKIPKIGPGAHVFQRPFLRGLFFFEWLIVGGAYLRREICVSKSIGLALGVGSKFTVFALFYFVFEGYFPRTSPRGEARGELIFGRGFFALPVWGAYTWRGFFSENYGMRREGEKQRGGGWGGVESG